MTRCGRFEGWRRNEGLSTNGKLPEEGRRLLIADGPPLLQSLAPAASGARAMCDYVNESFASPFVARKMWAI